MGGVSVVPSRRRRFAFALGLLCALAVVGAGGAAAQTPPEAADVEVLTERFVFSNGANGPIVLHLIQLVNIGPRVAEIVPLSLPDGATSIDASEQLSLEDGILFDPEPLAVGEARQYTLTYEVPWTRAAMPLRRPLFYPTEEITFFAQAGELHLRGVELRELGTEDIGGVELTVYAQRDLEPTAVWQVVIEASATADLPSLMPAGQRSDPVEIWANHPLPRLFLLAALLVVGGTVIARVVGRRRSETDDAAEPSPVAKQKQSPPVEPKGAKATDASPARPARNEVARLKEEIVRLDVAYHNEELDEDVYKERRGELRRRLISLLQGKPATDEDGE